MKYDVFISYSRKDSAIVKDYCEYIKKAGLSLWIDEDGIETGDEFKRKIVRAINESRIFLFFSSVNSNDSPWTVKEVNVAVLLKKRIIPIKLDDTIYEESLLFDLAGLDYLEHYLNKQDINYKKLLSAIGIKDVFPIVQVIEVDKSSNACSKQDCNTKCLSDDAIEKCVFTVGNVEFSMLKIQGGIFNMGSNTGKENEKPVHKVKLDDYMCAETTVTQELWKVVMGYNPSRFKSLLNPVESITWDECQEFLRKLNEKVTPKPSKPFRLLTEAEWEFAARGGHNTLSFKYSGGDILDTVGWYRENNIKDELQAVKRKSPNELGIYDMSGGVWELCNDWYGKYNDFYEENPKGPNGGDFKVVRGGSCWFDKTGCTVSFRKDSKPNISYFSVGFRLAL